MGPIVLSFESSYSRAHRKVSFSYSRRSLGTSFVYFLSENTEFQVPSFQRNSFTAHKGRTVEQLYHNSTWHVIRLTLTGWSSRLFPDAVSTTDITRHQTGWEDSHELWAGKDLIGDDLVTYFEALPPEFGLKRLTKQEILGRTNRLLRTTQNMRIIMGDT
jgi:hypothetical protein